HQARGATAGQLSGGGANPAAFHPRPKAARAVRRRCQSRRLPPSPKDGSGCQAAPAPVRERTSSPANFSSSRSLLVTAPMAANRKPNGMEMRPGLENGIGAGVVQLNSADALLTSLVSAATWHVAAWAGVSFAAGRLELEPPQQ